MYTTAALLAGVLAAFVAEPDHIQHPEEPTPIYWCCKQVERGEGQSGVGTGCGNRGEGNATDGQNTCGDLDVLACVDGRDTILVSQGGTRIECIK